MRKINYIVVHCSATREGRTLTPEALEAEHRRRGFRTTGYHYYIRRNGTTVLTRPPELVGAHMKGYNKHSIGICYEGGLDALGNPKDTRTPEQRAALDAVQRRTGLRESVNEGLRWGRLYGGAAGILWIRGQEALLERPLDPDGPGGLPAPAL